MDPLVSQSVALFSAYWPLGIPSMVLAFILGYLWLWPFVTVWAFGALWLTSNVFLSHWNVPIQDPMQIVVAFMILPFTLGAIAKWIQAGNA